MKILTTIAEYILYVLIGLIRLLINPRKFLHGDNDSCYP